MVPKSPYTRWPPMTRTLPSCSSSASAGLGFFPIRHRKSMGIWYFFMKRLEEFSFIIWYVDIRSKYYNTWYQCHDMESNWNKIFQCMTPSRLPTAARVCIIGFLDQPEITFSMKGSKLEWNSSMYDASTCLHHMMAASTCLTPYHDIGMMHCST